MKFHQILALLKLLKITQIDDAMQQNFEVVIANAHKFGASKNVDLQELPRDRFDTIIVDEAHHYPAPTWTKIVNHFTSKHVCNRSYHCYLGFAGDFLDSHCHKK